MIQFACSHCGKALKGPSEKVGAMARCPGCGKTTRIPAANAAVTDTNDVELIVEATPKPAAPMTKVLRRAAAVVLIVVVLLAGIWGGMAWRAGGLDKAPKSFVEFFDRLRAQAKEEE